MAETILKVENVGKEYRLGQIGGATLREELQRLGAKIRKKEDPTLKIGYKKSVKNGKIHALKNVSFEAERGEAIGIIGRNGAGKSTLLKLITGVTAPTNGTIYLNGRVASMLEVGTGFHPELTGRENIYVNGAILGMTKKDIDSKIEDIIDFSECREFIDTPVKRYSSGMYVKLAFSVAAHLDAEIMIMDEVLAVGDVAFQNKCIKKMKEIADSGRTILYVSHNMSTVRNLCKRCIIIEKGEKVFDGDTEDAIAKYISSNSETVTAKDVFSDKRPYKLTFAVRLSKVEITGGNGVYKRGENLCFLTTFLTKTDFADLKVRAVVSTLDGVTAGVAVSESFAGKKGESNEKELSLDLSDLLPDKYKVSLTFTEADKNGNYTDHDCVFDALFFEILPDEKDMAYKDYNVKTSGAKLSFI